jgi:hypothetical protein
MGTVITYSHSFSGYGSRPAAGLVSVQPVSTLRSGIVMNVYVEPSIRCTTVVRDRRDGRSCPPSLFSFPLVPKRNTPRHRGQTVSTEAAWLKFLALAESERKATVSLLQVILETVC